MLEILKDSTESVIAYPDIRWAGQATSASVRVGTPAVGLPDNDTWDSATVDSVSASTNAASNAGTDTLSFASDPTATAGRRYLVSTAAGQKFFVEVLASGTTTTLADPLPMDVPSGSTFVGVAITHALTAAETASSGSGLVKVKATIASVEYKWDVPFRIVRARFGPLPPVGELLRMHPDMLRHRADSDETLTEAIHAAWVYQVRPDLEAKGLKVELIDSAEALWPAIGDAARWRAIASTKGDDDEASVAAMERYERTLRQVLGSVSFWYDAGDANAVHGEDKPQGDWQTLHYTR